MTRFAACTSCWTPTCKSSPLVIAGSSQGSFFSPFPWQMTDSMYDGMLACGLPTVNRLPCGLCGRPWTMITRIFLVGWHSTDVAKKSSYLQGHVAQHVCSKRGCGQVWKFYLSNTSSHQLTQPVFAVGPRQRFFLQLQRSTALRLPEPAGGWIVLAKGECVSTACVMKWLRLQSGHVCHSHIWAENRFPCWPEHQKTLT